MVMERDSRGPFNGGHVALDAIALRLLRAPACRVLLVALSPCLSQRGIFDLPFVAAPLQGPGLLGFA